MSSNSLPVVQHTENRQITLVSSDELELKNARENLLRGLDDIINAVKANRAVQTKADELGQKGWFASIGGVISGENDKDLASMVKALGGSLETTQAVVQVMLRLQTRKDRFLREFQSVLVDKIVNIQSDTKMLDANQRAMALNIVSALQDQVEEQLQQYNLVDQHEHSLKDIGDRLSKNELVEEEFREALTVLSTQTSSLRNAEIHLSNEIETLQSKLNENDLIVQEFRETLTVLRTQTSNLMNSETYLSSEIQILQSKLKENDNDLKYRYAETSQRMRESNQRHEELHATTQQMRLEFQAHVNDLLAKLDQASEQGNTLERRVDQLELAWSGRSRWKARLQQHSIGIASLLVALLAIAHTFRG